MSGKHTPGPWTIGQRLNIEAPDPFCGRVIVANAAKASGIIPDPEQEANARLIAAAPKMLAALERLLELNRAGKVMARCWGDAKRAVEEATGGAA